MERNNNTDDDHHEQSSPYSWWSNSHNRPPHSQWLHSTLSELDSKIKMILHMIEDDGDTFAKRAEMYYQKRPQLIEMVQDLQRSYTALADKYDQLRSESSIKATSCNDSLSNSSNSLIKKTTPIKEKGSTVINPRNTINNNPIASFESPNCIINFDDQSLQEFSSGRSSRSSFELCSSGENSKPLDHDDLKEIKDSNVDEKKLDCGVNLMRDNFWDEQVKFSKLLEENLSKQAELIKKNEENKELVNELRKENKVLLSQKSCGNNNNNNNGSSSSYSNTIISTTYKGKEGSQRRKFRGLFCMP